MKRFRYALLALVATILVAPPTHAQRSDPNEEAAEAIRDAVQGVFDRIWVPRARYTNSPHVRSAFRSVVRDVRNAVVEVRSKGRRVARGGLVGPDGWIVTKASLVRGPVTCRLRDGREYDAKLVGVDSALDLAMLKVAAKDLPTLDLAGPKLMKMQEFVALRTEEAFEDPESTEEPPALQGEPLLPGDWLATVGLGRDPIAVGVLSVLPRAIDKRPGFLGIKMNLKYRAAAGDPPAVQVDGVTEDSAAGEAGVQAGDLIVSVNSTPTPNTQELGKVIRGRNPGDRVTLEVRRGGEAVRLVAVLRGWQPNPAERRAYYQNSLGGELSERRFGFPMAFQHDTVIDADDCGGPVVDLEGRVVGFNISRAGRTETYALPASAVRDRLFDLMSGRLAPAQ